MLFTVTVLKEAKIMTVRDVGGLALVFGGLVLIGFGIWISKSATPLWGLLPLFWFIQDFRWTKE